VNAVESAVRHDDDHVTGPGLTRDGAHDFRDSGNVTRTVQTLPVVRVDKERGLLLVKGSVPGADGGHIVVRASAKTPAKKGA